MKSSGNTLIGPAWVTCLPLDQALCLEDPAVSSSLPGPGDQRCVGNVSCDPTRTYDEAGSLKKILGYNNDTPKTTWLLNIQVETSSGQHGPF